MPMLLSSYLVWVFRLAFFRWSFFAFLRSRCHRSQVGRMPRHACFGCAVLLLLLRGSAGQKGSTSLAHIRHGTGHIDFRRFRCQLPVLREVAR